jgi:predicted esterase YcpF (UPF0227 family)
MNIIYLHGLESKGLTKEKRNAIESLGHTVDAPLIDYNKKPMFDELTEMVNQGNYDLIIGSSMGGRLGYWISNHLKKPALLFNPALNSPTSNKLQPIPIKDPQYKKQLISFGREDDVIDPKVTLNELTESHKIILDFVSDMGHRIPTKILAERIEIAKNYLKLN